MSSKIKIGISLQNYFTSDDYISFKELVDTAKLAEDLGFHSVWVWDHLVLGSKKYYPVHESLIVHAAVASHTSRVRLGTGVYLLTLRNPLSVAKQLTAIDHLSNGRITFGVAAGWYEREFKACGVPFKKRGEILVRNISIIKRLLTEDYVDGVYDGLEFDKVRVEPKPVQKPHPPIWLGGYVEKALERVGMVGDGWVSYFYTPSSFRKSWEKIANYAAKHGRNASVLDNCVMVPALIDNDRQTAMKKVNLYVSRYCDLPPWSEASVESSVAGSRDECIQQVGLFQESGVKELVLI
ncbi:MAG: LLM class flavin-dependent oxidoreductase, partial [Candidatus Caldarchaeum sp.]|nr:LLM class flavin-dependent oxidoreductase [Candidatus Caldarchaeum sp.]